MAPFTVGKFGLRALSQSLAREFGPQGIHVAHTIVDGALLSSLSFFYPLSKVLINTNDTLIAAVIERDLDNPSEKYLQPDAMAQAYVFLANQDRTSFTQEMDLRFVPFHGIFLFASRSPEKELRGLDAEVTISFAGRDRRSSDFYLLDQSCFPLSCPTVVLPSRLAIIPLFILFRSDPCATVPSLIVFRAAKYFLKGREG